MKMPETIDNRMFAPCGMNCAVCYVHVGMRKHGKPCPGCQNNDDDKPEHCRQCKIRGCAIGRGHSHCYLCGEFPCKLVKNLERSYNKRYHVSLVENSLQVRKAGVEDFLLADRLRWLCPACGGAFSLHDGVCSECGRLLAGPRNQPEEK